MTTVDASPLQLWREQPLSQVKIPGMGPRSIEKLSQAGIVKVIDLLSFLPKDYLDFSAVVKIGDAPLNQHVLVQGDIIACEFSITKNKRVPVLEILVDDGYGALRVVWFNQPYLKGKIKKGQAISLRGKIRIEKMGRTMNSPKFSILQDGVVVSELSADQGVEPVYRQVGGLRSDHMAAWIQALIQQMPPEESLPEEIRLQQGFPTSRDALTTLHKPPSPQMAQAIKERRGPALGRLVFEEFFHFQKRLRKIVEESQHREHAQIAMNDAWIEDVVSQLPFKPTNDQRAVLEQLAGNLKAGGRLYALVQGDVGCGKTLIGLIMAYVFSKAGWQSAFLCPTTVLAGQHFEEARKWLGPLGVRMSLMTARESGSQLKDALAMVASGEVDLVIGTHRIFQKDVVFKKLGLAMIDEQHRFGVDQRRRLLKKSEAVHYLAFSATPIPRSLAMTVYGDYQVLQIREKPANRIPVKTIRKKSENRDEIIRFALSRIARGESVFWVFPLIEGEEEQQEQSACQMFEAFKTGAFAGFRPGLVHGRMHKDDIRNEMERFRSGEVKILVATTVIEVGVDVPQATIMVVENANQFGLSQLHQLRGRVGRSDQASYCFLVLQDEISSEALARMRFLEKNNDGFHIAEFDLKQRGAGQLLGKKQSGEADFRFGDPWLDRAWMEKARALTSN